MRRKLLLILLALALVVGAALQAQAAEFAVWLDGNNADPTGGGSGILTSLTNSFGAGSWNLVTTSDLETPGFLNSYKAVVVSRYDSAFGTSLSAAAAANVQAFVGAAGTPNQGAVAVFTNDAADNFYGSSSGDPYDANLNQLFVNAAGFAAASGHGFIGEFNGAVMAMTSNSAGFASIGLLSGNASSTYSIAPEQFTYDVGPIGSGNAIDAGVTFPFTDSDTSTFLTKVTNALPGNIVDIYTNPSTNGDPAVLANSPAIHGVPEPGTVFLALLGLLGLAVLKRKLRAA